jgi:hypothetical protein
VKGRGEVELARLGEELNQRLTAADITVPGLHQELQGSDSLYERAVKDRATFAREGDAVVAAFLDAVHASAVKGQRRAGMRCRRLDGSWRCRAGSPQRQTSSLMCP